MKKPAIMADARIPVPVAESQLKVNTASSGFVGFSGVGVGTTGGVRMTTLCNPATENFGAETLLRILYTCGIPQMNTSKLNNTHGTQARMTWERDVEEAGSRTAAGAGSGAFPFVARADKAVRGPLTASAPASVAVQLSRGRQHFKRMPSAAIEHMEAMMSTSHGPWKFETRNCGMAKATPAVSAAGQTPNMPRKPACAQTTQNGTINEKKGSCRPTIFE